MPEANDTRLPAIELVDVNASSGAYEILTGLNARFYKSETSIILGNAGSGKSTFLKTAAGLVVPDQGTVLYHGQNIYHMKRKNELAFRADTGFVFQDAALWADTSILENVLMPLRVHKAWMGTSAMAEAARVLLSRLGYDEGMAYRPADLSTGEQKLVSIARAIIHDPSTIFMDDPTSNLDEDATEHFYELLTELRDRQKTIIIAANNSEMAYRFADCLAVIKSGTMVACGRYEDTLGRAEAALSGSISRLRARGGRQAPPNRIQLDQPGQANRSST
jgi:phospholipid/cholesterol/gamma-HCH transport system ATP-binding protein